MRGVPSELGVHFLFVPAADALGVPVLAHTSDVLDMPVDPNEPTYCLCHQVSYGEMIGCDNPDVSHVFGFACKILYILKNWFRLLSGKF